MQNEHQIIAEVYAAKEDTDKASQLIQKYLPFIRAEATRCLSRVCTEQDDEYSVAMIAFHEAIQGYEKSRGAFLKYAAMLIRSRIIDYQRKESRHQKTIPLYGEKEGEPSVADHLADERDRFEEAAQTDATRQEIEELAAVMARFGIGFSDVAENSPRQKRTLEACASVIRYAAENGQILEELLKTQKLPVARLALGTGVERKTLERHRKYILAMLLIQTNGYEIIRGHLKHMLKREGGRPA